jgi:L-fuculose-phosphate aldolase
MVAQSTGDARDRAVQEQLLADLVAVGRKIVARDLVVGPGGNLSAAIDGCMFISPSGAALDELRGADFVPVKIATGEALGPGRPSSEWEMHLACYRARPDITAVVHTHPPIAIGVISTGVAIEPLFPDFAVLLPTTRVVDYIIPTTPQLARAVGAAAPETDAILLRNHGVVTLGKTLREAYYRSELLETSARILVAARTVGHPRVLTEDETRAIRDLESEKYRVRYMQEFAKGGDGR